MLGVSQATAYRLVRLFREGGTVSALVDRKRGRRKDHHTLDKEREEIIRTTIARFYLSPTRPPFSRLVREVETNCLAASFKAPNWRTIKNRLESIDIRRRAKRRGEATIERRQRRRPGSCVCHSLWKLSRLIIPGRISSSSTKKRGNQSAAPGLRSRLTSLAAW